MSDAAADAADVVGATEATNAVDGNRNGGHAGAWQDHERGTIGT